jgi:hypothetical protein
MLSTVYRRAHHGSFPEPEEAIFILTSHPRLDLRVVSSLEFVLLYELLTSNLRVISSLLYTVMINYCRVYECGYRRGFGLVIGFADHLYTCLGTTSNYSAIADFHTLQAFSDPQCPHWWLLGNDL